MFGPTQNPNEPTFVNKELLSFAGKVGIIKGRPTYRLEIDPKDAQGHKGVFVVIALYNHHIKIFLKMNGYSQDKDQYVTHTMEMVALSYKDNWGEKIQHKLDYHFGVY